MALERAVAVGGFRAMTSVRLYRALQAQHRTGYRYRMHRAERRYGWLEYAFIVAAIVAAVVAGWR